MDLETPPRNKKKKKEKHQKMFSVNFWHSPLRRQSAADCIRPNSIHCQAAQIRIYSKNHAKIKKEIPPV
jgi:hypothetical protein